MVLSLPFSIKALKRNNAMVVVDQDDDSTSSSTLTAVQTEKKCVPLHNVGQARNGKKSVRFGDTDMHYKNTHMTKTDVKELWYGPAEYRFFRSVALDASQHITATEKRNRAPFSYQRVMERAYAVCSEVPTEATKHLAQPVTMTDLVHLQRWLEVATSRVGLEKWSIRSIANDKALRRRAVIDAVTCSPRQYTLADRVNAAEAIREESERLSRPSRLFSHTLALALAAAVVKDHEPPMFEEQTTFMDHDNY